jgi:Glu-tRNA(Gln) amidotransferase subunit E-like FAD-binding protein
MNLDYEKLGFKAGLEIHQQLDANKLFCNCPSVLRSDDPKFIIKRNLHAVAGESGMIDIAAKFQVDKKMNYFYEGYDTTCLVELDEEPPHKINQDALKIAIEISLLLNCKIIPVTQIMRKTVINGSNTSGFQRTVMIAQNGHIKTSKGKVGINFILLEEDSARKINALNTTQNSKHDDKKRETYRLDRLGLPMVEVVTAPDIKDAKHAQEVALKIGDILRSCKVRRGIGTIRQDINISILGENRVEIKGMQNMDIFVKTIEEEILRQKKLSDLGKPTKMEVRNANLDATTNFLRPLPGSARMYPETDVELLHIKRNFINEIKKNLPKLKSEIEDELKTQGLSEEIIKMIFKQNKFNIYRELINTGATPKLISKILFLFPKEISKKEKKNLSEVEEILNKEVLLFVLEALRKEKIQEGDLKVVLGKIISGVPLKDSIKLDKKDLVGIEEEIMKIIREKPGLRPNAYMGLIMKKFGGAVSPQEVMEIIKGLLK